LAVNVSTRFNQSSDKQVTSPLTDLPDTPDLVHRLSEMLRQRGLMVASAESCTGGMIAAACTDLAGSSDWFDRGFVTYSNAAKTDMLGVPNALIDQHGAVSEPVARAMALGAVSHSRAQVSVAVTGVAGPAGGSAAKPVGTVWFGWCVRDQFSTEKMRFEGDRAEVRGQAVRHALIGLLARLSPVD
jgi:nicotinamide-nucleotide amidase